MIETDLALGGGFIPAGRNPLPPAAPAPQTSGAPPAAQLTAQQKAEAMRALEEETSSCMQCGLGSSRTNLVFGEGDPAARCVFVGEGPGQEEDRTGRPFVGRAGQLLTKMIQAMGLRRSDVYICNMVKCRPPGNRNPEPQEVQSCWSYLVRQLQIIQPAVIVTMGNPATKGLLDTNVGITRLRGTWQKLPAIGEGLEGIAVMPTFHPAYVLRRYDAETRGKVWDDLQKVMDRLGLKRPG